jgi:hypothetical protein
MVRPVQSMVCRNLPLSFFAYSDNFSVLDQNNAIRDWPLKRRRIDHSSDQGETLFPRGTF